MNQLFVWSPVFSKKPVIAGDRSGEFDCLKSGSAGQDSQLRRKITPLFESTKMCKLIASISSIEQPFLILLQGPPFRLLLLQPSLLHRFLSAAGATGTTDVDFHM